MKPKNEDFLKTFLAGFSLTMGNPKTIVFYLAILPTVIPLDQMTPLAFAELTVIVVVVLLIIGSAMPGSPPRPARCSRAPRRSASSTAPPG